MDDTTPKFLESVTEHPDVQRLIKQVIRGDYMVKELRAENAQLKRALGHPEPDNSNKQYMFCGYCGKEGAMTIDELQQHILSCEKHPIFKLQAELKAKDELLFAYESVKSPINPLCAENAKLKELVKIKNEFLVAYRLRPSRMNRNVPEKVWSRFEKLRELDTALKGE